MHTLTHWLLVWVYLLLFLVCAILWWNKPAYAKLSDPLMTRGDKSPETIKLRENVLILILGLGLHTVSSRVKFINETNRSLVPLLHWEKVYPSYTATFPSIIHTHAYFARVTAYVHSWCHIYTCIQQQYELMTAKFKIWMLRVRAGNLERVAAVMLEIIFLTPHQFLTPKRLSERFITHMIFMQTWIISSTSWLESSLVSLEFLDTIF